MSNLPIITRKENPDLEWIPKSDVLYNAYLVPEVADLLKLGIDQSVAEKIVYRVIDGGETSVIAGKPISYNFLELCNEANVVVSPLVKPFVDSCDFYLVRLCCSFRSHSGTPHPFVMGRMEVTFSKVTDSEEPIVFDMFPIEVTDPMNVVKEVGISTELKFQNISASIGPNFKKVIEYTEITPIVTSFGKQTSVAGWEYLKSITGQNIRGNREGFIILMSPKGNKVRVTVDVKAHVKENFLADWVFPTSKKWKKEDFSDMKAVDLPLYRAVPVTEEELQTKRFREDFHNLILGKGALSEAEKSCILPFDPRV
jgi:hypothetical protein